MILLDVRVELPLSMLESIRADVAFIYTHYDCTIMHELSYKATDPKPLVVIDGVSVFHTR